MSETLPGATNRELREAIDPAVEAAKAAGRELDFSHNTNRHNVEVIGEHGNSLTINTAYNGGAKVQRIDGRITERHPEGDKVEYHAYRDEEGRFPSQSTRIERTDQDGNVVYEHVTKNPRAVELVAKLAAKRVVRLANQETKFPRAA